MQIFRQRQILRQQEQIIEQARIRLQQLQRERQEQQAAVQAWPGGDRFVLSHIEGAWQVPVRWAEGPSGLQAVISLEALDGQPGLPELTVFALQSAFPERARLEELERSGWALVRAWPINAPEGLGSLAGSGEERYALCALTVQALWQAGQHDAANPEHPPGRPGLELRA